MKRSPTALPWIGASLLLIGGCGGSSVTPIPVSGTITFDGGPPPADGNVSFSPIEVASGLPRRPASASFRTDGLYAARSFKTGDGLLPGRYQVLISCYREPPDASKPNGFRDASYIADDFEPPELVVEVGSGPITRDFNVRMKKDLRR